MSVPPTVLLADDSLAVQRVVSLTFADQPVRIVVAKDGQDAINRMGHERPDLVLADTNMPCVDGYELARWVRQQPQLSAVPVLLLAGVTDPVDEQRLHDSGANGVLEKPFEPSHVISRVKELLGIKTAPPAGSTRLVTAADMRPVRRPSSPGAGEPGAAPPAPPSDAAAAPTTMLDAPKADSPLAASLAPGLQGGKGEGMALETGSAAGPRDDSQGEVNRDAVGDVEGALEGGRSAAWFSSGTRSASERAALAEELGVSAAADLAFYGQPHDLPRARGLSLDFASERTIDRKPEESRVERTSSASGTPPGPTSDPADVFASLLAAEQGDSPGVAPVASPPVTSELSPGALDQLADRVVERLGPGALRDDLQRGLALGLREAVGDALRESVALEVRAAVAEAVQTAMDGTLGSLLRGAIHEAVAAAVPAAVEHHVGPRVESAVSAATEQSVRGTIEPVVQERLGAPLMALVTDAVARETRDVVAPLVQRAVSDVMEPALRASVQEAVAAAIPAAVLDAVRGDAGGQVREIVHDTAERLIREEIARIRERRSS